MCGCIPKSPAQKKKTLTFLFADLHIKLTHHANEDIQYKDLGRLRCFYTQKTRGESRYPSCQVRDFWGA